MFDTRPKRAALLLVALLGSAGPSHAQPATQTISPRRLLEVADLANPAISPDGTRVAFRLEQASVEHDNYDSAWYVQDLNGPRPPRQVGDGGAPLRELSTGLPLPSPAIWSPDGRWIFYRALMDGKIGLWRAAADGSGVQAVTADPADVRDFSLTADGETLIYSVGADRQEILDAEQAEYDRGVRIDDSVMIGGGLVRSSRVEGRPATQRFIGNWFRPAPLLFETPDRWKAVVLATLTPRALDSTETPPPRLTGAEFRRDLPPPWKWAENAADGRVAILTRIGDANGLQARPDVELAVLPTRDSAAPVTCRATLCVGQNISDIQWRPDTDEVLFTVSDRHEGRAQSLFGWDVSTGQVRRLIAAAGLLSGSQRAGYSPCGVSERILVCVAASADRPPRLEAIDLASGDARVLFEPNAGLGADIQATTPAQLIRWTDARGREFVGQMFEARRSPGSPPPPLFVTYYTCDGFLRGGVGDEWPLISLAEAGVTSVCINGRSAELDVFEHYGLGLFAVEGLVKMLAEAGKIDRARVGMGGLSYGGEVTMWTLMNSDVVKAASIASPSITPNWYLFNSLRENFRSRARSNWQIGAPDETPDQWRALSPAFNLDRIRGPILFQMPEQEYLVSLEYVLPMIRRRQAELYAFPEEAHIKFQPRHKLAVYERNLDWFRFWLQDYEDPDPARAEQYRRWREMRAARDAAAASAGPTQQ
ncbi:Atxe2 family lasso peptide isopeptidase [Brevundimonas sp.]|uniref:Atxe2 family lasso peptide isopeptidase n=1 Tax=Brevundimonas sp. TaxID=1871086 RepID=UPI001AC82EDD|nr:Atxe2 family lasso peptide isopeptidase [Brevundimonas sp.]MBN9464801.1 Atxe2 family lasso peptide isopeptidase [Brevundimonas sp.]